MDLSDRDSGVTTPEHQIFGLVYVIFGLVCGAIVGYLIGPRLPYGEGYLPLSSVLTFGLNLQDSDKALQGMAEEAFIRLLLSIILGAAVCFQFAKLQQLWRYQHPAIPKKVRHVTKLSQGAILVTEEDLKEKGHPEDARR
jgi:hypothetical protein